MRHVRGVLFVDYVRMLRSQKHVDWTTVLAADDQAYLHARIEPDAWYPMGAFERLGQAILSAVTRGELFPVQLWGRYSVSALCTANPGLLAAGDPAESLARFRVLRQTFFDFPALELPLLHLDEAHVVVGYHMAGPAEEAATLQTLGFFEGLLEQAGARDIRGEVAERCWAGDPRTLLLLRWKPPVPAA